MAERPLAGLRVLELARVLAGPWIGQTLADLGADVVKVEAPAGDETRGWGPPFAADGAAAYFHAATAASAASPSTSTIRADLGSPGGWRRRPTSCVENFKVGGLARFGLDHAAVAAGEPGRRLRLGHRLRPGRAGGAARRATTSSSRPWAGSWT